MGSLNKELFPCNFCALFLGIWMMIWLLIVERTARATHVGSLFEGEKSYIFFSGYRWNSWNHFGCNVDEVTIRETADAIVSTGLAYLGYKYINIDDCWAELNRDSEGYLVPKLSAFPSGIFALVYDVHIKGLKIGIYSDAGTQTCSKTMPGSLGHEEQDANTFALWVSYIFP
ncbi:alpha-galactosidase-like [Chenopodium quinoa]|uniref:alpha-galactosidase-like n=1 Tax=Chenopodium quinoa TaxID=63459 RepID=UPI000B76C5C3|nr:alpha-galactosidase-like [Chenopodium quinoa]